jgi:hypothetical protein
MENENQQLRNRVSALQADLETSEAVQRDFVQLSQQLQVILLCLIYLKTNRSRKFPLRFNWKKFVSPKRNFDGNTKRI